MLLALKNAIAPRNRAHDRYAYTEPCVVQRWGRDYHAVARNISEGGMSLDIQGMGSTTLDAELTILLRDFEPITAIARWSHKRTFGLQFKIGTEDDTALRALLDELATGKPG